MLKISLIISLIGFVMFLLATARVETIYKSKYGEFKTEKLPLIYWIRMIIMFLVPLLNIFLMVVFAWCFLFANEN